MDPTSSYLLLVLGVAFLIVLILAIMGSLHKVKEAPRVDPFRKTLDIHIDLQGVICYYDQQIESLTQEDPEVFYDQSRQRLRIVR